MIVFVGDILISSRFREEHEAHIRIALQMVRKHHPCTKLSKCEILQFEVVFLGHVISMAGIMVDPTNQG